jgi:hypothetical protein
MSNGFALMKEFELSHKIKIFENISGSREEQLFTT